MLPSLILHQNFPFNQIFRLYSSGAPTHYDVLNVKKNCTAEDIRSAFIRLSKKYHPDAKGAKTDPKDTAKFVKISEAYHVLSKSTSRDSYDQDLLSRGAIRTTSGGFKNPEAHRPWEIKPDYNPNPGPYYGIKGVKRVSNAKVMMILLAFAVLGVGLGVVSLRYSLSFNESQLDKRSKVAGEHHSAIRSNARTLGNDEQLKQMVGKILAKPTES